MVAWRRGVLTYGITAMLTPALLAAESQRAVRMSESFGAPVGALPDGWVAALRGPGTASIEPLLSGRQGVVGLSLLRPVRAAHNAAVYFTGWAGMAPPSRMADLDVSVVVTPQGLGVSSASGIVLRAETPAYSGFSGYFVAVGGAGESAGLSIHWNPTTHIHFPTQALAFSPVPALRSGADLLLRVTAVEHRLKATLWTLDAAGETRDQLASVSLADAEHVAPGHLGLRTANGNSGPIGAMFRNLHVEIWR